MSSSSSISSSHESESSCINTSSSYESESEEIKIMNNMNNMNKKYFWINRICCYCCICICIIIIIIFFMNILIMINVYKSNQLIEMNMNNEIKYKYKMVYYDEIKNERIEGEIIKEKNVRGYTFSNNENGAGYGYGYIYNPMSLENDGMNEYRIEGECSCCFECIEDDNCEQGKYCMNKECVECKNDEQCDGEGEGGVCNNKGICMKRGSCRDHDECMDNEICNNDGECVKGCRDNKNCKYNEICSMKGECIKEGCKDDNDCEKGGGVCIDYQCSLSGCRNNFDCNDYDHVCIDNQCVFVDEKTQTCTNNYDCSTGYYCNFEYFICAKHKKETSIMNIRRNQEIVPALCSLYGMITLFVMATSTIYTLEMAKNRLSDECNDRCSSSYLFETFKSTTLEHSQIIPESQEFKTDSICKGRCQRQRRIERKPSQEFADQKCHTFEFEGVVSSANKNLYFGYNYENPTRAVFDGMLNIYCSGVSYEYWIKTNGPPYRRFYVDKPCKSDNLSIKCRRYRGPEIDKSYDSYKIDNVPERPELTEKE